MGPAGHLGSRDLFPSVQTGGSVAVVLVCRPGEIPLMSNSDKRKQSLYFPEEMLREIKREAQRQDRSLSWIVQKAWKLARLEVSKYPSVNDIAGGDDDLRGRDE